MQLCILHLVLLFLLWTRKGPSMSVRSYFVLPRVTVLYTWSCLLSLVRFVESEISSLHGPVKLNLIYQDKRRFGELSLTANLGDPFCGFQHPKCCRNLSIRQQDHFGRLSGQQGIYPPHFSQKSLAFRLQKTAKFKYPLSIPWAKWLCPVFFQLIAKATLLHRDLTNDNPSWLLNPWVSGLLTSMVQLLNPPT